MHIGLVHVCVCVCVCVEIILTEGVLELADFHAWGKTYECEVYNGTSYCVLFPWNV